MIQPSVLEDDTIENNLEETSSSPLSFYTTFWLLYAISICAFLGASARASLAYYLQCDDPPPASHQKSTACVTSSQSALFVDLPANLLGSFVMGVLLHQNHETVPYCQAWQVGFCGSLTTFSSWNMQMVKMLEQGDIAMAIVGYILGTFGAYGSFVFGTALSTLVRVSGDRNDEDDDYNSTHRNSSDTNASRKQHTFPRELWLIPPTLVTCGLLVFSLTLKTARGSSFASTLAPLIWAAPAGALTRYFLSVRYNTAERPMRGTLIANWTACIFLAAITGLEIESMDMSPWTIGFLGSLSTVSTWIKEIHCHDPPSNWLYAVVSLGGAMLWSLAIYVPMHRFL